MVEYEIPMYLPSDKSIQTLRKEKRISNTGSERLAVNWIKRKPRPNISPRMQMVLILSRK